MRANGWALGVALLAVTTAPSCKYLGGKPDCNKACEHLVDLAREDIKTQNVPDHIKSNLIDQADKSRASDVAACVKKCESNEWNGNCLQEAKTFLAAKDCK